MYNRKIKKLKKNMGDLYALDFDGVICDSCGESSVSAVKVHFITFLFLYTSSIVFV